MIDFPLPRDLYIDTSVVVAAAYPGSANADACSALLARVGRSRVTVYFSEVLRLEYGRAVRRLATRPDRLPAHIRERYELDRFSSNALVRQRWLSNGVRRLNELLSSLPAVIELPMSQTLWLDSIRLMGETGLDATDALHVATAIVAEVRDIATGDADYSRIPFPRIHLIRDE